MNLAHLSLTRCGHRMPHVPDNQERMQAFRALQPVEFANARFLSDSNDMSRVANNADNNNAACAAWSKL